MAAGGYKVGGFRPDKYVIAKSSGRPLDPEARYFVLRYDPGADPHARVALRVYAESVQVDNLRLATDLLMVLGLPNHATAMMRLHLAGAKPAVGPALDWLAAQVAREARVEGRPGHEE